MSDTRHRCYELGACAVIVLAAGVAPALAQEPQPVPAELLEYLGSWEGDDSDWLAATLPGAPGEARAAEAKPGDRPLDSGERGEQSPPVEQEP